MLKIATIVGTRPELIKLSLVFRRLEEETQHTLIHTGQNFDYELNKIFFNELKLKNPDYYLNAVGKNCCETIGNIISQSFEVLNQIKPDGLLIYGDTNSCLSAYAAKRLKIPIFHMEAGNRCFDARVPEEINRKIVDHLSDVNLTISHEAKKYLENEGVSSNTIFQVGSSLPEIYETFATDINSSTILKQYDLKTKQYICVSSHREENVDEPFTLKNIVKNLLKSSEYHDKRIIWPVHPRTKDKLNNLGFNFVNSKILITPPCGLFDYINLQKNSFVTLSDSGSIWEEANILKFPAISLRRTHERLEAINTSAVAMFDPNKNNLHKLIDYVTKLDEANKTTPNCYIDKNISYKVINIIHSYVDYINTYTWKK